MKLILEYWQFFGSALLTLLGVSGYGIYIRKKDHLILDIRNLLEDCRALESWDDRSELKLSSWIGGDERDLHRKSLCELRKIYDEMVRYYRIHCEMRDGEPYGSYQSGKL